MMMNKRRILALIGFVGISCLLTVAQISDNQLWTSAIFKLRVNKQLRFDIEEQTRFNKDITHLNVAITEAGALYDLNKYFNVKLNFRYYYDPESHNRYRYSGDFGYAWSKKGFPLEFKCRLRYQRTIEEHTKNAENYLRNKFSAGYNLSKIVEPYLSYESYFKLNYINKFTNNRYTFGLDWKLSSNISLSTYYMLEDEFGEPNPKFSRVIGVELSYGLKL